MVVAYMLRAQVKLLFGCAGSDMSKNCLGLAPLGKAAEKQKKHANQHSLSTLASSSILQNATFFRGHPLLPQLRVLAFCQIPLEAFAKETLPPSISSLLLRIAWA